jgi:hypothetical protein
MQATSGKSVGIETPRFRATSRGGTPLSKSVLPDWILLLVINRFLPPTRPSFFTAASPARVRSTSSSRSICAKLNVKPSLRRPQQTRTFHARKGRSRQESCHKVVGKATLPMSNGNHTEDDNESCREPATEMFLGEEPAPDNSANQSTDFPHRSDLANWGDGHRHQNEDI